MSMWKYRLAAKLFPRHFGVLDWVNRYLQQQKAAIETSGEASHSPQPSRPSSVRTRTSSVSCVPSAAEVISGILR